MEKKLKLVEEINYFINRHDIYESSDYNNVDVIVKITTSRNQISKHNSINVSFIYPGHDSDVTYGQPRFNHVLITDKKIYFVSVSETKPNKKSDVWFYYRKKIDLIREEKIETILN